MRNNQISIELAMRIMRFFNERPGSTKNNDMFYRRMWNMYPATTENMFNQPYDFAVTERELKFRRSAEFLKRNPLYVAVN